MNNQEAKLILRAYRPGGEDASDPLMAGALEQARQDPELQKWLAEEQIFDLSFQAKLRNVIAPPPELKANLLALGTIAPVVRPWRRSIWLAAAASLALLLGLAAYWLNQGRSSQLDSFRQAMVGYSMQREEHVTFETSDIALIQQWLRNRGMKAGFELPDGLRGKPAKGCKVVAWNGQKVALICFMLAGGHHVDLFVVDGGHAPNLIEGDAPQFTRAGATMTAAWSKGDRVYLLTEGGDGGLLRKLLPQS